MIRRIIIISNNNIFLLLPIPLLLLSLLFLFPPHFLSPPRQLPIPPSSELSDLHLFTRATTSTTTSPFTFSRLGSHNPTLKIAFLFLTNSDLYFHPLWSRFFNATSPALYSIYIHADPGARIPDPPGVFFNRFVASRHTERSSATLISAARRLIASAILDDSNNFYFALLSQTCVPLHSFNYVYKTLFETHGREYRKKKSFIEILANESTLPARYIARGEGVMMPEVPFSSFRVGSQFFVLNKKHAVMVLKERKLWRKFRLPCLRVESCYPEEHYFPTYLEMEDPEGCTHYTVTRVNWTDSVNGHPHTYRPPEVSRELIYTLRSSNFSHDYLFARKFSPDCLEPLMELADDVLFKD